MTFLWEYIKQRNSMSLIFYDLFFYDCFLIILELILDICFNPFLRLAIADKSSLTIASTDNIQQKLHIRKVPLNESH